MVQRDTTWIPSKVLKKTMALHRKVRRGVLLIFLGMAQVSLQAQTSEPYTWKSVQIHGAGL